MNEKGVDTATGRTVVEVDPQYFRPTEVDLLLGDPSKAERVLGWRRSVDFPSLVRRMVKYDMELFRKDILVRDAGYKVTSALEEI